MEYSNYVANVFEGEKKNCKKKKFRKSKTRNKKLKRK
ncbi:Protein CBG25873 [Caenorhabditis briggsae]|uniref:Protein CBG25873 n=1 Tax=Caenorhabditis briggsae TaxID=6238 RepID=B6IIV0_CAEBR|nr:Protein CBG25873 [Caenorhabditis briggsae]CAR99830.1 Protein CBG25873 [Caenorhabditis briggsae]